METTPGERMREIDENGAGGDPKPVDLTNCDREPIHTPGRVQGFGCLLALREADGVVEAVSENAPDWLGVGVDALLGQPLGRVAGLGELASSAARARQTGVFVRAHLGDRRLSVLAHDSPDGRVLVEVEAPESDTPEVAAADTLTSLAEMAGPAADLGGMGRRVVEGVREMTGFDRVMLCRFDERWQGQVIAESRADDDAAAYLGLWFPASDIPPRARALYAASPVRLIADLGGVQASLRHAPGCEGEVDMSCAVLRGVSPVHVEYLSNMGVASSLTLSVRRRGRLWGLIACHGSRVMTVGPAARRALGAVAAMVSQLLTLRAESDQARSERELIRLHAGLVASLARGPDAMTALRAHAEALIESIGACGFAVRLGGGSLEGALEVFGRTPPSGVIRAAMREVAARAGGARVYSTHSMSKELGVSGEGSGIAGLLAGSIGERWNRWAVWFRPEVAESATWAEGAEKPREIEGRLGPRQSFEAWKRTVKGCSVAWSETDTSAAQRFGDAVREFDDAAEMREMEAENQTLSERNARLGHFVDSVAHDLRAPLASIGGYSDLLRGRLGEGRTELTVELVERIDEAGARMRALIEDLLRIARLDGMGEAWEPVSLKTAGERAAARLADRAAAIGAVVEVDERMPTVRAPRVYIDQVMENLIENALKYGCPEPGMRVRVSACVEGAWVVLRVRDGGPGVAKEHRDSVFDLFRRLHSGGEGTGAGLFLVRRIATLLEGEALLEDAPGGGAVFVVRLPGSLVADTPNEAAGEG